MLRHFRPAHGFWCWVLSAGLCGCGKNRNETTDHGPARAENEGYFKTPWQDESQFIVMNIISDLAGMVYYAKHQALPKGKDFIVMAQEKEMSSVGAPVYHVTVQYDKRTLAFGPCGLLVKFEEQDELKYH